MKKDIASKYDHFSVEDGKYEKWVNDNLFTAKNDESKDPFCIVIPPPNVTGKLHLGHAWDTTLQDIIARHKRMQGFDMLWLAGMDHAGIATQAKVDERLRKDGISRYDLGREKFLDAAFEWKEEYASHIREQWSKMGLSLDYTRERFTLDKGLSDAVCKVFVDYYNAGLIYQGERIINWDPKAKTALSNIEVYHEDIEGAMYTFNYRVKDSAESFHVATTRPETMFGDVCVVVHPKDERFIHLIGKTAINPANNQELIIIADDYIDMEFGTGAMKCTPAHDPNDYQIAIRHNLPKIKCMNDDGSMNEICFEFEGMDRFDCRKALVEKIQKQGDCISIEKHIHPVGHSERTHVIVEPYLSKQWFVKMKPLADDLLKNQKIEDESIEFFPPRFEKTLNQWMENIEDWCISRQLWWGHRIPAWYHNETNEIYVNEKPPVDIENWHQDEDVLDTWFSSALWPFATLGWPNETADFKRYFPNDVLVTGYDIIFFWVARMAFSARYLTNSRPFKHVLIHGLIRDEKGRKMSKSLGNGVDPMDVIKDYGVDALRFFLTTNSTPGQDLRYIPEKVEASWNFINKIWNASRFVMMNIDDEFDINNIELKDLSITDKWILNRLNTTIESVNSNMEKYEFALAGSELEKFIWNDFCSWYIELSKSGLNSDDQAVKNTTVSTLIVVLKNILKLLHPFMPFVTDEIYQTLFEEELCTASWPVLIENIDNSSEQQVNQLLSIITTVREIKKDYNLKPSLVISAKIANIDNSCRTISSYELSILEKMCKITIADIDGEEVLVRPILNGSISVPMGEIVDVEAEKIKLNAEKIKLEKEIERSTNMLGNERFTSKAPASKIEEEQNKLTKYKQQYQIICDQLIGLK